MPTKTSIEWTDYTSNPIRFRTSDGRVVWACEKTSPGCKNCYADALSQRYTQRRAGEWNAATMATLTPFLDEKELHSLLHMKSLSGKRVFIGDMTDIFGDWVERWMLAHLFAVFALRPDVTWQVLTKRSSRLRELLNDESFRTEVDEFITMIAMDYEGDDRRTDDMRATAPDVLADTDWPLPNVWLGVSCEDQERANERIPELLQTPAAVRFISAEPLIGRINLHRIANPDGSGHASAIQGHHDDNRYEFDEQLDWVIVGGESGPGARPCDVAWIRSIVQQCQSVGVAAFVKQLGAMPIAGRSPHPDDMFIRLKSRKGGDPTEWTEDLRVREFPQEARS